MTKFVLIYKDFCLKNYKIDNFYNIHPSPMVGHNKNIINPISQLWQTSLHKETPGVGKK